MTSSSQIGALIVRHFGEIRRDLPWRRSRDPYAIWVSEIMLQQTRVATVIPYWERWMARFPTVQALAVAPLDDVLAAWAGLGYYSRARNLQKGAQHVVDSWRGELPRQAGELRAIPGIGPYTAGAIASIAYGERAPLVDGNVARVLARVFGIAHDIKSTIGQRVLWERAGELMSALPADAAPGNLNQGLMELGATACAPTGPRCLGCPLASHCVAARDGRQAELPVVAKRKRVDELPVIERELLWIEQGGAIVLVRRAATSGLWAGLWELPEVGHVDATFAPAAAFVAHHDQVLSHRRLRVRVRVATLATLVVPTDPTYDRIERVALADAADLGIAAATAAILRKYQDAPWATVTRSAAPDVAEPRARSRTRSARPRRARRARCTRTRRSSSTAAGRGPRRAGRRRRADRRR
ncbi:MAG: A/G-specific adenine glycosylase [Proteobacteria bacterium]|nr:A/G-specific adenine glycosylase [Pseudomonadota bacterium]